MAMALAVASVAESFVEEQWPLLFCGLEVSLVICVSLLLICKYERCGRRGSLPAFWLFVFRAFAFLYFLPLLIFGVVTRGVFAYRFYTQWTFTLTVVYFALAMLVSGKAHFFPNKRMRYLSRGEQAQTVSLLKTGTADEAGSSAAVFEDPQKTNAGCLGYLLQILFQVSAPAVLLTDGVYWLVLVPFVIPSGFRKNFLNINVHGVNAAFVLVEFMVNSMPFPWFRCGYFVLWSTGYTLFLWIMYASGFRWWPYPFLDVSTPSAPIWYFGLAILHLVSFGICWLLGFAKYHICSARRRGRRLTSKSLSLS